MVILWIFGMVAQGNLLTYDLSKLHIYCNTLQAIAAGYLIASIAVYTAVHMFDFKHIGNIFAGGLGKWLGDWNDFVQGLAAFAVIWLITYWMYRKKLFVKI